MISLILCMLAPANAQTSPWRSHSKLVGANGQGVLIFNNDNNEAGVFDGFSSQVYHQENAAAEPVPDLLYDTYFGLDGVWLTEHHGSGYHFPGSGVMSVARMDAERPIADAPVLATEWAWVPIEMDHPGYVHMLELENRSTEAKTVTVSSLHNVHVGDALEGAGAGTGNEEIWSDGQDLVEFGSSGIGMWFQTTRPTSSYTCDGTFHNVGAFDGRCGTEAEPWLHNDQVGGFEWTITIGPESTEWVDTTAMFFSGHDTSALADTRTAWRAGVEPEFWVNKEGAFWNTFHSTVPRPTSISETEFAVFKQNLTFLKMAQVTESGDSYGQITASLPVGAEAEGLAHIWNITWVRDQAYAAVALARAGKLDEARAALEFTLQGKAGGYTEQVGQDYGLSVCRLYGDGSEWSDDDGTGPNIELDNFGLTLWAIGVYVDAGGDSDIWTDLNVMADVADPLVNAIDDLGLIQADSSIWERHWNGNEKHFTFTSAMAGRGLYAAHNHVDAEVAAGLYLGGWDTLRRGICTHLMDPDLGLLGNTEESAAEAIDLSAVAAMNYGLVDAQGTDADNTLASFEATLAVANGMGFKRNDDGDLYDEQEWVVMDLAMAEAYRRNCQLDKARAIEGWITEQAWLNNFNIPELMNPETGAYAGPTPMLGYGAGAYILELYNREDAAVDCANGPSQSCEELLEGDGEDDTGDTPPPDDEGPPAGDDDGEDTASGDAPAKGCGCATGGAPSTWLLFPLMLIARVRRRSAKSLT